MGKHKQDRASSEKEHFEILVEDLRSQFRTVTDGLIDLKRSIDERFVQLEARMDQRFDIVEQAIMANALGIKALKQDVSVLKQDAGEIRGGLSGLTERFDAHLQVHAA